MIELTLVGAVLIADRFDLVGPLVLPEDFTNPILAEIWRFATLRMMATNRTIGLLEVLIRRPWEGAYAREFRRMRLHFAWSATGEAMPSSEFIADLLCPVIPGDCEEPVLLAMAGIVRRKGYHRRAESARATGWSFRNLDRRTA